ISCESNAPLEVTVCGNGSLLTQITVSSRATVRVAGSNFTPSMTTVCADGFCAAALETGAPAPMENNPSAPNSAMYAGIECLISASTLFQLRLDHLGVLEVRDKRRSHLDEQRFELLVLRIGNEHLVDRIEHLLVVRDLVVDVGLVERRALQS